MGQVDVSGQVFRARNSCRSAARSSRRITIDPHAVFLVVISRSLLVAVAASVSYNYSQITCYRVGTYSCRWPCNIIIYGVYFTRDCGGRELHRKHRPQACVSRSRSSASRVRILYYYILLRFCALDVAAAAAAHWLFLNPRRATPS